ncbi:MAG: glycosyltransferase family 39 protein [candidate division Zixibacteria bacterium]|nr:glycosyltransferase family 39 protein [candidate division Zixibacteria bacterium]
MVLGFFAALRKHKGLLIVLVLGLAVRLTYLAEYSQAPVWNQLTVDNWYHHHWAETIANGNVLGDTTYFRAPLYSLFLGALYYLFGASLWTARLFGLVIGLASIVMTYLLAQRISGNKLAWGAAALQALFPAVIYFESELLLDPMFCLLTQLAVHRFLIWLESRHTRDIMGTGLLFGLAAITRPTVLIAVPLIVIWMIVRPSQRSSAVASTAGQIGLFLCGLAICVIPVSIRNLMVAGDPVLIASQGGINLFIGNNDTADGLSAILPEPLGHNWTLRQIRQIAETDQGGPLKPGEISDYWRDRAIAWILSHPGKFLELYAKRVGYQLVDREISNNRQVGPHFASLGILRYNPLSFGVIFPLALIGLIAQYRRNESAQFIMVLLIVYSLAMAFFFVNARFRLPLLPYYFVFAIAGVCRITEIARQRPWLLIGPASIAVAAVWFSFSPPMSYPQQRSSQNLMSRGLYQYDQGKYQDALTTYRQAAALDPTFPETNLSLGACFFRMGQEDSASFYFDREITLHPQRPKAYHNLASLHLVNGRYTEALHLTSQALTLAPYSVPANIIKLRALAADPTITIDSLWRAVETATYATDEALIVLNWGASILARDGCNPTVEKCLHRAERAVPPPIETDDQAFHANSSNRQQAFNIERAKTYYLLGYCAGVEGYFETAISYSLKALSLDPLLAEAYINLYSGYLSTGRLVTADSVLTEAANRFPEHNQIRKLRLR